MSTPKKHIAILGSTGSIGKQALEIIARHPDRFVVEVLTAQNNLDLLAHQARTFQPNAVVIGNESRYRELSRMLDGLPVKVFTGEKSIEQVVETEGIDLVLNALVGYAGMLPTLASIRARKSIALANKESLVVAGQLIMEEARRYRVPIIPVDSEHSAIFQCLVGEPVHALKKIILTASGGPFRSFSRDQLRYVTREEALNHPNWSMGDKITIDSATMVNKGFEVIEAHWLFDVQPSNIEILIHPQSVVHSLVMFSDGSLKAQLGLPDMRLPILYAFGFPERLNSHLDLNPFDQFHQLTFEPPDKKLFRALELAYRALEEGGTASCVMNAANEVAVAAFLNHQLPFLGIPDLIEQCMDHFTVIPNPELEQYQSLHHQTIRKAQALISEKTWKY